MTNEAVSKARAIVENDQIHSFAESRNRFCGIAHVSMEQSLLTCLTGLGWTENNTACGMAISHVYSQTRGRINVLPNHKLRGLLEFDASVLAASQLN